MRVKFCANDSSVSTYVSKEIRGSCSKRQGSLFNSIFSGMPGYLILTRHPGNLIKYVDNVLRIFKMPVSVLLLALTGFYILSDVWYHRWIACRCTGLWLSFFLFLILAADIIPRQSLLYMAPMIGVICLQAKCSERSILQHLSFTELLANHPQITYYAILCLLVFIIVELIWAVKEKQ